MASVKLVKQECLTDSLRWGGGASWWVALFLLTRFLCVCRAPSLVLGMDSLWWGMWCEWKGHFGQSLRLHKQPSQEAVQLISITHNYTKPVVLFHTVSEIVCGVSQ